MAAVTVQISDLDLTDALEAGYQALRKQAEDAGYPEEHPAWVVTPIKQGLLEQILPILPYVIKQVGQRAWSEGHQACDRDWAFTADITTPDKDRQPFTNPYNEYPVDLPTF